MSDPKEQQSEPDELDLDTETVRDLEPTEAGAEDVKGGQSTPHECCTEGRALTCIRTA